MQDSLLGHSQLPAELDTPPTQSHVGTPLSHVQMDTPLSRVGIDTPLSRVQMETPLSRNYNMEAPSHVERSTDLKYLATPMATPMVCFYTHA